jgi:hypothetical protein
VCKETGPDRDGQHGCAVEVSDAFGMFGYMADKLCI